MATVNLNNKSTGGSNSGEARPVLPTDIYRMKIIEAKVEDDTFGKPDRLGDLPQNVVITWEMSILTEEQADAADEAGEDWSEVRIWSRFKPYYGNVKAGGPSKLKAFLDSLAEQKLIEAIDPNNFEIEALVGIEQRVSVERYTKTMGPNAGQWGNKAVAYAPVRAPKAARNAPQRVNLAAPAAGGTADEY